jgi:flagellar hook-associated protein 1 FlgK
MADLFALLVQSGNNLAAHSAALATAGNNIANANTPGYSRQSVELVANPGVGVPGPLSVGQGVSVGSVLQARDQFLERQVPQSLAAGGRSQTESDALQGVSALNPDLPGGLTSAVSQFYSSLRTLAQNPGDLALRQGVVLSSQNLARSFTQTTGSIESARTGIDAKLQGEADLVNTAAKSLADLNLKIQVAHATGGQVNDLEDSRRIAADTLSRLTGATPYTNDEGDVSMALPGGTALVAGTHAGSLSVAPDGTNSGHMKFRLTKSDGAGPYDLPASALGGEVGGLLDARDGTLKTAVSSLDSFAFDLATGMNTLHAAGFAMDGTTGRDLFTVPATSVGASSQIAVNAAISADPRLLGAAAALPAASGDNRNILAMLATETQALASGNDPVATLQKITGDFGTSAARAQATSQHDSAMVNNLNQLRASTSGVSIDEEMINLTKAQKAYEAVSKVIATADTMLDTLLNLR